VRKKYEAGLAFRLNERQGSLHRLVLAARRRGTRAMRIAAASNVATSPGSTRRLVRIWRQRKSPS